MIIHVNALGVQKCSSNIVIEPSHEKTNNFGFRRGLT